MKIPLYLISVVIICLTSAGCVRHYGFASQKFSYLTGDYASECFEREVVFGVSNSAEKFYTIEPDFERLILRIRNIATGDIVTQYTIKARGVINSSAYTQDTYALCENETKLVYISADYRLMSYDLINGRSSILYDRGKLHDFHRFNDYILLFFSVPSSTLNQIDLRTGDFKQIKLPIRIFSYDSFAGNGKYIVFKNAPPLLLLDVAQWKLVQLNVHLDSASIEGTIITPDDLIVVNYGYALDVFNLSGEKIKRIELNQRGARFSSMKLLAKNLLLCEFTNLDNRDQDTPAQLVDLSSGEIRLIDFPRHFGLFCTL